MTSRDDRCENCEFSGGRYSAPDRDVAAETLKCRRRAPIATGGMMAPTMTIWPAVVADDWCGEFVARAEMEAANV